MTTAQKRKLFEDAIEFESEIYIDYTDSDGESSFGRKIKPRAIVFKKGDVYVSAYCNFRKGIRTFKLDSVMSVSTLAPSPPWGETELPVGGAVARTGNTGFVILVRDPNNPDIWRKVIGSAYEHGFSSAIGELQSAAISESVAGLSRAPERCRHL